MTAIGDIRSGWSRWSHRDVGVVRGHHVNREELLLVFVVTVAFAIVAAIGVSRVMSEEASTGGQPNLASARVDIGDPLVVMAPSNGHDGAALVLVSGKPLFPLATGATLTSLVEAPVEAQQVRVQAIAGERGVWVGESLDQRVFVEIPQETIDAGSPAGNALRIGELVNVSGRVKVLPQDLAPLGVTEEADVAQLNAHAGLIYANSVRPL